MMASAEKDAKCQVSWVVFLFAYSLPLFCTFRTHLFDRIRKRFLIADLDIIFFLFQTKTNANTDHATFLHTVRTRWEVFIVLASQATKVTVSSATVSSHVYEYFFTKVKVYKFFYVFIQVSSWRASNVFYLSYLHTIRDDFFNFLKFSLYTTVLWWNLN